MLSWQPGRGEAVSAYGSQPRSLVASVGPTQARKGSWME